MITTTARLVFLFQSNNRLLPITNVLHVFSGVLWEYSRCEELLKSSKARLKGNTEAGLDKIQDLAPQ